MTQTRLHYLPPTKASVAIERVPGVPTRLLNARTATVISCQLSYDKDYSILLKDMCIHIHRERETGRQRDRGGP